jgi:TonB family protein
MDGRSSRAYHARDMADFHYSLRTAPAAYVALALACVSPPPAQQPAASEPEPSAPAAETGASAILPPQSPASIENDAQAGKPLDARTKEEIQKVITSNRDKVRSCYDKALESNPGIHGDLVISFVINLNGTVKHAEVNWAQSDLHVPELDTCAAEAVKALKFPASSRGFESKINYPFNFNPPNSYAIQAPTSPH